MFIMYFLEGWVGLLDGGCDWGMNHDLSAVATIIILMCLV